MAYLLTPEGHREIRERDRSNRRKSGPVYDPRTITEPVATVAQRMEIERLRRSLASIPWPHKDPQSLRRNGRMPNTAREADRLIGNLWRNIGKRLDRLPESERTKYRIYAKLQARRSS